MMMTESNRPWPLEIKLKSSGRTFEITFDNKDTFAMPAEFLRIESPSAEVKGHGPGQEVTVPGKRDVTITSIEPTGNYAVRLVFDDGHDSGLYSWDLLHRLGREQDPLWQRYLEKLEAEGLTRDP